MDIRGFNELPALGEGASRSALLVRIGAVLAKAVDGVSAALVAVFDGVWELRQRAYERRLLAEMDGRERSDLGIGAVGGRGEDADPSIKSYWDSGPA